MEGGLVEKGSGLGGAEINIQVRDFDGILWGFCGLTKVSKSAKIAKKDEYVTYFMGLEGFYGYLEEGVCPNQRGETNNLRSLE